MQYGSNSAKVPDETFVEIRENPEIAELIYDS